MIQNVQLYSININANIDKEIIRKLEYYFTCVYIHIEWNLTFYKWYLRYRERKRQLAIAFPSKLANERQAFSGAARLSNIIFFLVVALTVVTRRDCHFWFVAIRGCITHRRCIPHWKLRHLARTASLYTRVRNFKELIQGYE